MTTSPAAVPESAGQQLRALSGHEIQAAVAQVDQAIHNHDQWYQNVVRVLVVRMPPESPDLHEESYKHCRFGQWYHSESADGLRELGSFVALGEAHRSMHVSATRLLRHVEDDLPISVDEIDEFNQLVDHMRVGLESLQRDLNEAAQHHDPLTNARNRATLLFDLREQHALVSRGLQDCTIAMIDLDHFKVVNDTHGHAVGDLVLKSVAHEMQAHLRPYDRLYRYGGEEFLLCCPQTSLDGAATLTERMRAAIAQVRVPDGSGGQVRVTASFGLATLAPSEPVENAVERADKAMYQAKRAGRDRVETGVAGT